MAIFSCTLRLDDLNRHQADAQHVRLEITFVNQHLVHQVTRTAGKELKFGHGLGERDCISRGDDMYQSA